MNAVSAGGGGSHSNESVIAQELKMAQR